MKIIITDGHTLNPGDLTWEEMKTLGELSYYARIAADELTDRCLEAAVIVTNKTPITEKTIAAARQLKLIAVTATGYNVVDTVAARKHGVLVCNVPVYGTDSVAQHAFSLLLELTNQVGRHERSVRNGEWTRSLDWCYTKTPVIELKDKMIGIVGYGKIGKQVAVIAKAFGMKVIFYNMSRTTGEATGTSLVELFSKSDFISVHCPLTAGNQSFINKDLLLRMKSSAFLINTSRGQLINEPDLAEALQQKILAGAALDVLSSEPPPEHHPLIGLSNCTITPHLAWVSLEARQRIMTTTVENIRRVFSGNPQNVVN
jgi:glycerate dehydrogenase